jgi:hypothetical protein
MSAIRSPRPKSQKASTPLAARAARRSPGLFQFPDATVRVLPLLADPDKLNGFIDEYLNQTLAETSSRFVAWGRYVYAIVLSDDATFSESNNVGEIASRHLRLYVPVKWYQKTAAGERLVSTALVPVYSYANSATAAISISSVIGIPTMTAQLDSPPNTWLDQRGPSPAAHDEYMVLRGEVLPVLNLGQQATTRTIAECDNREPIGSDDVQGWRRLADRWAPLIKREHERKREIDSNQLRDAKTLALELLANGGDFEMLTLKQFRSADDPSRACYQALVSVATRIEQLFELEEIETPIHVRIHEYPSQAIVSTLGIVVKDWQQGGGSRIAVIEPVRPFWLRGRLRQALGTNVHVWTPTGSRWTDAPEVHTLLTDGARLNPELVDHIEDGTPQYLSGQVTRWLESRREPLSAARACAAVETVEPQIVIESVLSCEWEAWLNPRWCRGRNDILERLEEVTAGALPSKITPETAEILAKIRDELCTDDEHSAGMCPARHRLIDQDLQSYHDLAQLLANVQSYEEQLRAVEALGGEHGPVQPKHVKGGQQTALQNRRKADAELARHLDRLRRDIEQSSEALPLQQDQQLQEPQAQSLLPPPPPLPTPPVELFERAFEVLDGLAEQSDYDPASQLDESERNEFVANVRAGLDELRDLIVLKLAKSWQKPDNCIRRQTILHESVDRYFPREESFDEHWYKGPPRTVVEPPP